MPLVFKDEVCYEKTPDYFDRPFVPERMSKLDNAKDVKFVHVLCDPVRRSFSHFNHMFTVQATGQGGVGEAQPGFEFLNGNLIFYVRTKTNFDVKPISGIFPAKKPLPKLLIWLSPICSVDVTQWTWRTTKSAHPWMNIILGIYRPVALGEMKILRTFLSDDLFLNLCLDGTCPQRIPEGFIHWEYQMRFWREVYIRFISELIFIISTMVSFHSVATSLMLPIRESPNVLPGEPSFTLLKCLKEARSTWPKWENSWVCFTFHDRW